MVSNGERTWSRRRGATVRYDAGPGPAYPHLAVVSIWLRQARAGDKVWTRAGWVAVDGLLDWVHVGRVLFIFYYYSSFVVRSPFSTCSSCGPLLRTMAFLLRGSRARGLLVLVPRPRVDRVVVLLLVVALSFSLLESLVSRDRHIRGARPPVCFLPVVFV